MTGSSEEVSFKISSERRTLSSAGKKFQTLGTWKETDLSLEDCKCTLGTVSRWVELEPSALNGVYTLSFEEINRGRVFYTLLNLKAVEFMERRSNMISAFLL